MYYVVDVSKVSFQYNKNSLFYWHSKLCSKCALRHYRQIWIWLEKFSTFPSYSLGIIIIVAVIAFRASVGVVAIHPDLNVFLEIKICGLSQVNVTPSPNHTFN
jgi:hypothetical protein